MLKSFNKQNLQALRLDIDAALKQVEAKHGIKLGIANISFSADTFSTKLTGTVATETGRPVIPAQEKQLLAMIFNLPAEGLETIKIIERPTNKVWYFAGYNSRSAKMPINIIDENGKRARAPEAWVRMYLQANGTTAQPAS